MITNASSSLITYGLGGDITRMMSYRFGGVVTITVRPATPPSGGGGGWASIPVGGNYPSHFPTSETYLTPIHKNIYSTASVITIRFNDTEKSFIVDNSSFSMKILRWWGTFERGSQSILQTTKIKMLSWKDRLRIRIHK